MKPLRYILPLLILGLAAWLVLFWLDNRYRLQPYSQIEERLLVGEAIAQPPPGTQAVLNLCDHRDAYDVEESLWLPIDGGQAPNLEWLQKATKFIEDQRRAGRTVYVHCLAGMNRSGMVVVAYLMREHRWSRDQALAFAQRQRPQLQPNPMMLQFLSVWETALFLKK